MSRRWSIVLVLMTAASLTYALAMASKYREFELCKQMCRCQCHAG